MPLTIDILISTINQRIHHVPQLLMSPLSGVRYIVSHQTDGNYPAPQILHDRQDVEIFTMNGRGLSRNRNNAIAHATADIIVIADDDNRYTHQHVLNITQAYTAHPEADIICFCATDYNDNPLKRYPQGTLPYTKALKQGYYPSSIELTMRRTSVQGKIAFNTAFGLGAPQLCAGEEDVFMTDAMRMGLTCLFVNSPIVSTSPITTGSTLLTNPQLQITKGATFRYCYGLMPALWRAVKEAAYHALRHHANPFTIFHNMLKGITTHLAQ